MTEVLEKIESYEINGTVGDNGWLYKNREMLEEYMRDDMRSHDIIPVLDVPMRLTCSFSEESDTFEFSLRASGFKMDGLSGADYMGFILADGVIVGKNSDKVLLCEI